MESKRKTFKVSIIGGGSLFVTSIIWGLRKVMLENPFNVEISLFDINKKRVKLTADYCNIEKEFYRLPVNTFINDNIKDTLYGADIIINTVGIGKIHKICEKLSKKYDINKDTIHDGLLSFISAKLLITWFKKIVNYINRNSKEVFLLNLVNPTDIISNVIEDKYSIKSAGMCVEVEHLKYHIAYHLDLYPEQIDLITAGVNHDGWTIKFLVDGKDGYRKYSFKILELLKKNNYHPGMYGFLKIYELTGYFRSSAYHNAVFNIKYPFNYQKTVKKYIPEVSRFETIKESINKRIPIEIPKKGIHPEKSPIVYRGTGIAIAKLIESFATGKENKITLQIKNKGKYIKNFPEDVMVEIPVICKGKKIFPLNIGNVPDWLTGMSKLLAIQRKLVSDYLITNQIKKLKMAVSVLPFTGEIKKINDFVKDIHRINIKF